MSEQQQDNGLIGSLFTGYGGLDMGISTALGGDMRVAYTSDIEPGPTAIEEYHAHGDDCPNLGDITKLDKGKLPYTDVICGGSPCFPAGSLVLTDHGFTPIEHVKIGDRVLTHKGNWKPVTDTGSHIGDTIILHGQGTPGIECAPNHRFLSGHRYRKWDNDRRGYQSMFQEDGWTPAADMTGHMWLNMGGGIPELPIPPLEDVAFDTDFFYFVGRFLGDGWVYESKDGKTGWQVGVCCGHQDETSLRPHIEKLGWNFSEQDQRTGHYWRCNNRTKFEWFQANFGRGAANKHLPAWAFGMKREWRESLIQGYRDSDGCPAGTSGYRAVTVSKKLALGVKILATGLGYSAACPSVIERKRHMTIEGRAINERPQYPVMWYERARKSVMCGRGFWAHVNRIESGRLNVRVYNITVEDDHSYTIDGIAVQNCQSMSVAGLRAGMRVLVPVCGVIRLTVFRRSGPSWSNGRMSLAR